MKQKFSIVEGSTDEKMYQIMVENDPTSGLQPRTEQVGMYFWNRIWLIRPCTIDEMEKIVEVVKCLENETWSVYRFFITPMNKKQVQELLEDLLQENGHSNPLYVGTDDKGEKYRAALCESIRFIKGVA